MDKKSHHKVIILDKLANQKIPVPIDHQTGQKISFAVDESIRIRNGMKMLSQSRRLGKAPVKKVPIDLFVLPGEKAHPYLGLGIVKAAG